MSARNIWCQTQGVRHREPMRSSPIIYAFICMFTLFTPNYCVLNGYARGPILTLNGEFRYLSSGDRASNDCRVVLALSSNGWHFKDTVTETDLTASWIRGS